MRVTIIGGGILGTAHALEAVQRGHHVIQLEREVEARGATVRNFGLVWVSGRADYELDADTAVAGTVGTDRRPHPRCRVPARRIADAVAHPARGRGRRTGRRARRRGQRGDSSSSSPIGSAHSTPHCAGKFLAGLHCSRDAAVESRQAMPAIRAHLAATGRYEFMPGTEARSVDGARGARRPRAAATTATSCWCAQAPPTAGLTREIAGDLPVRRVRLQMMQTEPLDEPLTTAIADGDSFRYYPAFAGTALDELRDNEPQDAVAGAHRMQLLCVQRLHGGLTIGDTHEYDEPFPFDVDEAPYGHLAARRRGVPRHARCPPCASRWAGVYSQCVDPDQLVCRTAAGDGVWVITGPGGRGMTLGPAIAEQTAELIEL